MAPPRSTPRADAAEPLAARLRALAARWADDLRRADRFARQRMAILGTWALLSVVTLWTACPSADSLGATVQVLRESIVGGQQVLVANDSAGVIWTDVTLTLDDAWRYEHPTLRPQERLVLSMPQFHREGEAAPRDLKPRRLRLVCNEGRRTFDLR